MNARMSEVHAFFTDPEIPQGPVLRQWMEEDLKKSVEEVTDIGISTETFEVPSETDWKSFKLGDFLHFELTFSDGQHAYRTLRKGSE